MRVWFFRASPRGPRGCLTSPVPLPQSSPGKIRGVRKMVAPASRAFYCARKKPSQAILKLRIPTLVSELLRINSAAMSTYTTLDPSSVPMRAQSRWAGYSITILEVYCALRLSALRQVAPLLRLVYERRFAFLHYTCTSAFGNISFALSLPVKRVGVLAS